jgi:hypothetical protein
MHPKQGFGIMLQINSRNLETLRFATRYGVLKKNYPNPLILKV